MARLKTRKEIILVLYFWYTCYKRTRAFTLPTWPRTTDRRRRPSSAPPGRDNRLCSLRNQSHHATQTPTPYANATRGRARLVARMFRIPAPRAFVQGSTTLITARRYLCLPAARAAMIALALAATHCCIPAHAAARSLVLASPRRSQSPLAAFWAFTLEPLAAALLAHPHDTHLAHLHTE